MKIAIIHYGLGNLRSVIRGLEKAGANAVITSDEEEIAAADGLVLPGVGAFREGMDQLGSLQDTVKEATRDVPLLGICLGMQMLMETSEEHGIHRGLGLVPLNSRIIRFLPDSVLRNMCILSILFLQTLRRNIPSLPHSISVLSRHRW